MKFSAALSVTSMVVAALFVVAPTATAVPEDDWRRYVLAPPSEDVRPETVTGRGDVGNPSGLLDVDPTTTTTLTMAPGGPPASVLLDFGQNVSGTPYFDVTATSGSPKISMVTSEARQFIRTPADTSTATPTPAGFDRAAVESTANMVVGDKITFGDGPSQTRTITAVDATVTFAPALDEAVPAGTPVHTSPGAPSADDDGSISGAGGTATVFPVMVGRAEPAFRGGFRYVLLTLDAPGTVTISQAGMTFQAYRATPDRYRGWFISSSRQLNRMWFSGAYTNQLNMSPAGVQGAEVDRILDGAKRDRSIWTGDLIVQIPVLTTALGKVGAAYSKSSLQVLLDAQRDDGALPGSPDFFSGIFPGGYAFFYSVNYSSFGVRAVVDYFRRTGDTAFAESALPALREAVAYNASFVDSDGLVVSNDPDYWQTTQTGQVTKYSLDYFVLLREMAWFERQVGSEDQAAGYAAAARAVRRAVIQHLWSDDLGAYPQSNEHPDRLVADANALALEYRIHPRGERRSILRALRSLWLPKGSRIGEGLADPGGHPIEPFGISLETDARFAVRDTRGALELMRRTWGQMVNPRGPWYTGAFWEFLGPEGQVIAARDSLAHGWAAGPTQQLTERVLGIQPIKPAYRSWRIEPQPAGLRWARGAVPTGSGQIKTSWVRRKDGTIRLVASSPPSTSGRIIVPVPKSFTVRVDGQVAWRDGESEAYRARRVGPGISVTVGGGRHLVTANVS